jgi:DMSO/TMAO reductase YedYZ molybdopterin-dependent catalytic subunit
MLETDDSKLQGDAVPSPGDLPSGVVISPDTRRTQRVPPGQSRTKKWPVLDAAGPPRIEPGQWKLEIFGQVERPLTLSWDEFAALPRTRVFADFHCVTRWSRLGNLWEGVSMRELIHLAGGARASATHALVHGYDQGWTTNLPLEQLLAGDALVATHHDGEPLSLEHGAPARLIVPQLYAWKSAKWLRGIELLDQDRAGFWERNGYHMNGDPWREQRYGF